MFLHDWFKGLQQDEAEAFEKALKSSGFLRDRLDTVIKRKIAEAERVKPSDYDSPSWAYKAADREGYIRALNYVLLLTKENPLSEKD